MLYLPSDYGTPGKRWPLVLFLHGAGERGNDLEKVNADVKLTIYPEAGHDAWTATYDNPEMWDWLLSRKRRTTTAPAY
ncbi:MAG TPA: hypothetical protein VLM89_05085 [Phycisphaerae bacterium]|nr:hypothetical protein [Phycisphaerae bacterium]